MTFDFYLSGISGLPSGGHWIEALISGLPSGGHWIEALISGLPSGGHWIEALILSDVRCQMSDVR